MPHACDMRPNMPAFFFSCCGVGSNARPRARQIFGAGGALIQKKNREKRRKEKKEKGRKREKKKREKRELLDYIFTINFSQLC